mmetsp:Transcript_3774/g.5152  ORF Transcript_3774/g.5152 Transcript_3774/m.5152 type:complete len:97 (-) Transcript_3774:45-335(-)
MEIHATHVLTRNTAKIPSRRVARKLGGEVGSSMGTSRISGLWAPPRKRFGPPAGNCVKLLIMLFDSWEGCGRSAEVIEAVQDRSKRKWEGDKRGFM